MHDLDVIAPTAALARLAKNFKRSLTSVTLEGFGSFGFSMLDRVPSPIVESKTDNCVCNMMIFASISRTDSNPESLDALNIGLGPLDDADERSRVANHKRFSHSNAWT